MKKLMEKILLVAAILILFANSIYAADLYLDNGASGCSNGSTNYDVSTRVCGSGSETVYVDLRTCSNNLGSADHLYIRAGSYYYNSAALNWYEGSLTIDGNGQIVENYNSEVVWIQTGTDHTDLTNGDLNNPIVIGGSNNTLKGNGYNLFVWGCIIGSGSSNTVEGIDISGGWDHQSAIGGDAWYDMFRIVVSSNFLIKDSKIHDNYNHGTSTASGNKSAIMHGNASGNSNDSDTIIENCHFYNLVTYVAYVKYQDDAGTIQATYRKNFFDGVGTIEGPNASQSKQILVHNNVIVNGVGGAHGAVGTLNLKVYNNTYYGSSTSMHVADAWGAAALSNFDIYNNIFYYTGSSNVNVQQFDESTSLGGGYVDYNNYYQAGSGSLRFYANNYSTMTFAQWDSFLGSGDGTDEAANTILTDPGFNPDDSTLDGNDPTDFKRTTYTTNGRSSAVMGAYQTGSETIGLLNGASDTTAPTVTGTVIGTDGETVTITFDENVTGTENDTFTLDCVIAGDPVAMTYSSGSGGTALVFTAASIISGADSCTLDFDGDANDFEDDSGNDLVDFNTDPVTNNSTIFPGTISIPGNLTISSGSLSVH